MCEIQNTEVHDWRSLGWLGRVSRLPILFQLARCDELRIGPDSSSERLGAMVNVATDKLESRWAKESPEISYKYWLEQRVTGLEQENKTLQLALAKHGLLNISADMLRRGYSGEPNAKLAPERKALENIIDTLTDSLYSESRRIEKAMAIAQVSVERGGEVNEL